MTKSTYKILAMAALISGVAFSTPCAAIAAGPDVQTTNPNTAANTALIAAVSRGDAAAAEAALKNGAEANARDETGNTALVLAAQAGRTPLVALLLSRGAKPTEHSWYGKLPIVEAAGRGHLETVKLLAAGKNSKKEINQPDKQGRTAFLQAAAEGKLDVMQFLLGRGAALDARDVTGATALHLAAGAGRAGIVRFLLDRDPKPKLKDRFERTALFYAAANGHTEIVRLLLESGHDAKLRDLDGQDAFLAAVHGAALLPEETYAERKEVLTQLLEKGASVNSKDAAGVTGLMAAAEAGKVALTRFLLDRGADVNTKDRTGYTALGYAERKMRDEVAGLLKKAGARSEAGG